MRHFRRLPLRTQLALLLGLLVIVATWLLWLGREALQTQMALQRGRAIAQASTAVGAWASQYGGVWLRNDAREPGPPVGDYLEQRWTVRAAADDPSAPPDSQAGGAVGAYHSKSPALLQREVAQFMANSGALESVRVTSDRLFNPANAPNAFEAAALQSLRGGLTETYEVRGGNLLYARALKADASCMRCHDSPAKSPAAVRTKFAGGAGWGYRLGDVAGVVSVTVPLADRHGALTLDSLGGHHWAALAALLGILVLVLWWLHAAVIAPVRQLEHYADLVKRARRGELVERLDLDADELTSRNELHRLNHGVKAVARGLLLLQRQP